MKSSEEEELDKLFRSPFGSHPFAPGKRVGFPHAGFSKEVILTFITLRAKRAILIFNFSCQKSTSTNTGCPNKFWIEI